MGFIFDIILLMASGAATIYCYVLSRRLSRLNDTKNGLGASIASMSLALDQTQQALNFAKASSADAVRKLSQSIEEAERIRPEISKLIDELGSFAELAVEDIEQAKNAAIDRLERRLPVTGGAAAVKYGSTGGPGAERTKRVA